MDLVTVFRTFRPDEAQVVRSCLGAAGFDAAVNHELSAVLFTFYEGGSFATGGVLVQVPDGQAEEAREFLVTVKEVPA